MGQEWSRFSSGTLSAVLKPDLCTRRQTMIATSRNDKILPGLLSRLERRVELCPYELPCLALGSLHTLAPRLPDLPD